MLNIYILWQITVHIIVMWIHMLTVFAFLSMHMNQEDHLEKRLFAVETADRTLEILI